MVVRAHDSLHEWLEERLDKLPDLAIRRLFGGAALSSEGTTFGLVSRGRVYLKVDEESRVRFVEKGMGPFNPMPDRIMKSYYEAPPDVLEDEDALLAWSKRALEAALQKAGTTRPAKKSSTKKSSSRAQRQPKR